MDRRLLLFILLAMLILSANMFIMQWLNPPRPAGNNGDPNNGQAGQGDPKPKAQRAKEPLEAPPPRRAVAKTDLKQHPNQRIILGSADLDKFRMAAVLNTAGAGVEWVGLNDPKYLDLDGLFNKWGYLGYLALADARNPKGAKVNVVCPGTPSDGKLQRGDVIQQISGRRGKRLIADAGDVATFLKEKSRIGDTVKLKVVRNNKPRTVTIRLGTRPLELIRPETSIGPSLSFLTTLAAVFDGTKPKNKLAKEDILELTKYTGIVFKTGADAAVVEDFSAPPFGWPKGAKSPAEQAGLRAGDTITHLEDVPIGKLSDFIDHLNRGTVPTGAYLKVTYQRRGDERTTRLHLRPELHGVDLFTANWRVVGKPTATRVEFRRTLPAPYNLEFVKRYRLASVDKAGKPAYHLTLDVEIINLENKARKVVYQLDGPQGLPTEAWWYGYKISRNWGGAGVRDVVYRLDGTPAMINCASIAGGEGLETIPKNPPGNSDPDFVAVDARYFSVALRPNKPAKQGSGKTPPWFEFAQPLVVGPVNKEKIPLTNVSFRLTSRELDLPSAASGGKVSHSYTVFLGPKDSDLLASTQYGLEDLNYYGWPIFSFVARFMTGILRFFHGIIPNYGIAIILLTVSVRLAMFPLSRKQAIGAQKMQQLQPEMKRIAEKYKNNVEQRMKAQRELFRKHNYNPAGGCLLLFVQLPVFIGLYKGLSVDIALRQSPLIPGLYWCSDLSAPDRLFRWDGFMKGFLEFLGGENGWLGPYFNILPIVTIVLFLVHQKLFMPPPADEQQAMQHKMMKYMMIFFGFMFFKVPSGLCLYFIASSLWGIAERKLLPKTADAKSAPTTPAKRTGTSSSNGSASGGKRAAPAAAASGKKRRRRRRK